MAKTTFVIILAVLCKANASTEPIARALKQESASTPSGLHLRRRVSIPPPSGVEALVDVHHTATDNSINSPASADTARRNLAEDGRCICKTYGWRGECRDPDADPGYCNQAKSRGSCNDKKNGFGEEACKWSTEAACYCKVEDYRGACRGGRDAEPGFCVQVSESACAVKRNGWGQNPCEWKI